MKSDFEIKYLKNDPEPPTTILLLTKQSRKPVLAFQTLTPPKLGKWATTHQSVFSYARAALGLCCWDRPDFKCR